MKDTGQNYSGQPEGRFFVLVHTETVLMARDSGNQMPLLWGPLLLDMDDMSWAAHQPKQYGPSISMMVTTPGSLTSFRQFGFCRPRKDRAYSGIYYASENYNVFLVARVSNF